MEQLFQNRSSTTAAPWPLEDGGISLTVEDLRNSAGEDMMDAVNNDGRSIELVDYADWDELRVSIRADFEFDPQGLVPEASHPPVAAFLTLRSPWTCLRQSHKLSYDGDTRRADITLRRLDLRGTPQLQASLIRTEPAIAAGEDPAGLATARGALLATSDPWTIAVDERMLAPGRHIEVIYAKFGQSEHTHREADILFDIEFGEVPVLYINEALSTDLRQVLDSTATHGRTAAARDALFAAIGQGVWVTLAMYALQDIADEPEQNEDTWQYGVISRIASALDGSTQDNLLQICEWYPSQTRQLMHHLNAGAQRLSDIDKAAGGLIKAIGGRS